MIIKVKTIKLYWFAMSQVVHAICIEGVSHSWINNPENVFSEVSQIANESGFSVTPINDLEALDDLIRTPQNNIIIVNCHGETMPIPRSWQNNWQGYLQRISENVRSYGWFFVSVTGIPFFYCSPSEPNQDIGFQGLNTFLLGTNIRFDPRGYVTLVELSRFGKYSSKKYERNVPDTILCSRALRFDQTTSITRTFYSSGPYFGVCAIEVGKGFLIHNGLMADLLNRRDPSRLDEPTEETDRFLARISAIFALSIKDSLITAKEIFETSKDIEELFRKRVIIPLLRLKGFTHVTDLQGSDEHGRDVVGYLSDGFDNRINFGFQLKIKQIHGNLSRRGNIRTILTQLQEAFSTPFRDTLTPQNRQIHQMYVITSKNITAPAQRTIIQETRDLGKYIHFMDGELVLQEFLKVSGIT